MPWRRLLAGVGVTLVAVLTAAALLYGFGGMWPPSPGVRRAYAVEVAAGRQPAMVARFTIPVPGCVCHTSDPVLQMQHSTLRISQCASCHG